MIFVVSASEQACRFRDLLESIRAAFQGRFENDLRYILPEAQHRKLLDAGGVKNISIRWGAASIANSVLMTPPSGVVITGSEEPNKVIHQASMLRLQHLMSLSRGNALLGPGLLRPLQGREEWHDTVKTKTLGTMQVLCEGGAYPLKGSLEESLRGSESALAAGLNRESTNLPHAVAWNTMEQ